MKEALKARLQLMLLLANIRGEVIQQAEPGEPTKAHEAAALLKSGIQVISTKLDDAEPDPIVLTEGQRLTALAKSGAVATRVRKLRENIERIEGTLLSDHTGNPLVDWTDEMLTLAAQYVAGEIAEIQAVVEDL